MSLFIKDRKRNVRNTPKRFSSIPFTRWLKSYKNKQTNQNNIGKVMLPENEVLSEVLLITKIATEKAIIFHWISPVYEQ